MIRKLSFAALAALGLGAAPALAAGGGEQHIEDFAFSFEGPFGTYDRMQLQRGLQVFTEVCSACHGMKHLYFRNLTDPGGPELPEDQVKAYAAMFQVPDDSDEAAPGDTREGKPADHFPENTALGAPDLSVMAKARAGFHGPYGLGINQIVKGMGGPEYIASLLTGYTGEEVEQAGTLLYENHTFPGGLISMAPPLYGDDVEYADGTEATIEQESKDVAAFLMWAAEPKMMARKQMGLTSVMLLTLLSVLLYLTNKRLWAPIKRKDA
ncbi:cytochrome c1 [Maritimibacter sp. 55A14]|uniref:cytochrome c1 n=1 Tax=Maritimibacter sp. 55A14 TaxID=2174844 RepID=UPI000D616A7A|nr:cytochrome c1 [Maritimibacter sp. 55A14]PWE28898.1 cytochrome c1 [Maritimibacter sp. 55A14]